MPSISGHRVLVLGGSSGIGFAVAKLALTENIAHLTIASSNKSKLDKAVEELITAVPGSESRVSGFVVDLGGEHSEALLDKLLQDAVAAAKGPLDHIVNSLSNRRARHIHCSQVNLEDISNLFIPKLAMSVFLGKLAPNYMKRENTSSLTLISGLIQDKPWPGLGIVSSVASAVTGMAIGLALDISPIRVNAVSPGLTRTGMVGAQSNIKQEEVHARASRQTLVGRPAIADEAAEAFVYLMKDTYATGTSVKTSGGALIYSGEG